MGLSGTCFPSASLYARKVIPTLKTSFPFFYKIKTFCTEWTESYLLIEKQKNCYKTRKLFKNILATIAGSVYNVIKYA